ncbi:MAG: molybdopterin molybdotransferase MoeA [Bacteroidetes bacterium]|nr:molybdopterin molybdotransferase MoeA [Bacteroidota bacterium]
MIAFEDALKIVLNSAVSTTEIEEVEMLNAIERVLAEDIISDINMPPFDKSAVDGFACRSIDFNKKIELEIIETIPAGKCPEKEISEGKCSKIMTGAMLPTGADCVVMIEDIEVNSNKIKFTKDNTAKNICYLSEDIHINDLVLSKGCFIKPQHIAVLASVGAWTLKVYSKPKVGIISTGDELVEPNVKPAISQIRNSNAWQLMAQAQKSGAFAHYEGIAADNKESTFKKISEALQKNDIVVLTGGVSMGDFDYVPEIMQEIGIKILFKSIAVQPGRPTVFGIKDDKYIFGLPGNPVSSFVQFEMLVKPLIKKLIGYQGEIVEIALPLGSDIYRKKTERKSFLPVSIRNGEVFPIDYHGSAHIHSYVFADGIIAIEKGVLSLKKGEKVNVRQL